ncbi:putative histone-lysine N-methyltransferase [Cladorrhinum sp. PSN332]|nr:putative histone-lysine N-methyltransferase [Cladorrhinum sp. PSN332]
MATATPITSSNPLPDLGCGIMSDSSSFSVTPTDDASNIGSMSSTPPTSVSPDSMSLASEPDVTKESVANPRACIEAVIPLLEKVHGAEIDSEQQESGSQTPVESAIVVATTPLALPTEPPSTTRARRVRASLPEYNLAKLSGNRTRRARGDLSPEQRRQTIAGDAGLNPATGAPPRKGQVIQNGGDARVSKRSRHSATPTPAAATAARRATRLSGAPPESLTTKLATLGKRGKKSLEKGLTGLSRELLRLQDTNEFAHIDTRPVRYTVWSNGKYLEVDAEAAPPSPQKKKKGSDAAAAAPSSKKEETGAEKQEAGPPPPKKRRVKKWLEKGLYAGQETPTDIAAGLTKEEKKALAKLPELAAPLKPNKALPFPMFNGIRMLINGRDFKLPFDVCNPLPPGQPKPAAYRTMTKNRFVGDAATYWKKPNTFDDVPSKCVCKPEDGCGEDCQNRIMLYECDETNCKVGKDHCTNRAFTDLQERTKKGGRYRVGVEVLKTQDRGYGVRSNRPFAPNQIIMEYTGEIITEEECERRMNEEYKNNECYYLMSFDQNMIIDATTGSIARFVNHSCSPNCRMIKWIVAGQPRMALFAGDRPIMTGEELTYDYNFDPFSNKNVQKCLCGSPNCRGVLGPKPKEVKQPKVAKGDKKPAKTGGKRKLKDMLDGEAANDRAGDVKGVKKRKISTATTLKRTILSTTLKAAKGAKKVVSKVATKKVTKTIKKSVASVSLSTKTSVKSASKGTTKGAIKKKAPLKKTLAAKAVKAVKAAARAPPAPKKTALEIAREEFNKAYGKKPAAAVATPATPAASSSKINLSSSTTTTTKKTLTQTKIVATTKTTTTTKASVQDSISVKFTPRSTPGSAGRKRTPSRKALEASTADIFNTKATTPTDGSAAGTPSSSPGMTKIRLVSSASK